MIRPITVAFVLALASSAQAMPVARLEQPGDLVVKVREACGAGLHRVNGVCVRTPTTRATTRAVRCGAGLRLVNGRCIR
jgi:hypothetical protein